MLLAIAIMAALAPQPTGKSPASAQQAPAAAAQLEFFVETGTQRVRLRPADERLPFRCEAVDGTIPYSCISEIKRDGGDRFVLRLTDDSILRGSLDAATLGFTTESKPVEVQVPALRTVIRSNPTQRPAAPETGMWAQTRRGDSVFIRIPSKPISIASSIGQIERPWTSLLQLRVRTAKEVDLITYDEEIIRGTLDLDSIDLRLALTDSPLKNCATLIKSISRPAPAEVQATPVPDRSIELLLETTSEWAAFRFPSTNCTLIKHEIKSGQGDVLVDESADGRRFVATATTPPLAVRIWIELDPVAVDPTDVVLEKGRPGTARLSVVYPPEIKATQWFENYDSRAGRNPRTFPFRINAQSAPQIRRDR